MSISDILLLSKKRTNSKVRKFRAINDLTQESFVVEGPDIKGCRIIADKECARLGWSIENMRSVEVNEVME